jgi:hypothetical protein
LDYYIQSINIMKCAVGLLILSFTFIECYLFSMVNSPKNNIVKNKKGIEYRKYSNDNEKYLYANYLVSLRKFRNAQKSLNYNIFTNIVNNNISGSSDVDNKTVLNNNEKIAKTLVLANIKIDVSNVKYIQISTKNDTILIELDKNNQEPDKSFVNYDLGKIDVLISAISILMNVLNIH